MTPADRTVNDLTQYPVMPWVLSQYHRDTLDLKDATNFRGHTSDVPKSDFLRGLGTYPWCDVAGRPDTANRRLE